jgi:hypothetical protein
MAMKIFKSLYLEKGQFGIVPELGYDPTDNASDKGIKTMEWIAEEWGVDVKHAGNGREHQIGRFKVDGFIKKWNMVVEFHGCYFHGCTKYVVF